MHKTFFSKSNLYRITPCNLKRDTTSNIVHKNIRISSKTAADNYYLYDFTEYPNPNYPNSCSVSKLFN